MQKVINTLLKVLFVIIVLTFYVGGVFAGQTLEFKDGTVIKGEIQNETVMVKTSFGTLIPEVEKIAFVSEANVELRDGSKIMGHVDVGEEGLTIKTQYGTWTIYFEPEDLAMITFTQ